MKNLIIAIILIFAGLNEVQSQTENELEIRTIQSSRGRQLVHAYNGDYDGFTYPGFTVVGSTTIRWIGNSETLIHNNIPYISTAALRNTSSISLDADGLRNEPRGLIYSSGNLLPASLRSRFDFRGNTDAHYLFFTNLGWVRDTESGGVHHPQVPEFKVVFQTIAPGGVPSYMFVAPGLENGFTFLQTDFTAFSGLIPGLVSRWLACNGTPEVTGTGASILRNPVDCN